MTLQLPHSEFLIYEEYFIFFFISGGAFHLEQAGVTKVKLRNANLKITRKENNGIKRKSMKVLR